MAEIAAEPRGARGEWQPPDFPGSAPIWAWPPQPLMALKWVVGNPGYLFPWYAVYFVIAAATWAYLTPEMARMVEFRAGWVAEIYVRNLALLVLWVGGWHVRLYRFKSQGTEYKFSPRWLQGKSPAFLWGSQLRDNVFWSIASGCTVWTAYEVVMMWGYANGFIAWVDWRTEPVTFALMMLAIPLWREVHFYWTHRLLHWKPLYRSVHYLHHKNVDVGPWTGLANHPAEHIIYFSVVLLFWIVPSHPLMVMLTLQDAALSGAPGHAGFDKLVVKGKLTFPGSFFHYLHHRYFECNYGNTMIPFDKWLRTHHDGSPESDARMHARLGEKRA